jgi:hypothetical protein
MEARKLKEVFTELREVKSPEEAETGRIKREEGFGMIKGGKWESMMICT